MEETSSSNHERKDSVREEELRSMFEMFEIGEKGISIKSAEKIMSILGLEKIIDLTDSRITFEALLEFVREAEEAMTIEAQARRCFGFICQRGNAVSAEELRSFLHSVGVHTSLEDANRFTQAISRHDTENSFSKEDFVTFITRRHRQKEEQIAADAASSELTHSLMYDDYPD